MTRAELIAAFLRDAGWQRAETIPLGADASFRRYVRLVDGHRRALLMDAPPPLEDVRPWLSIGDHLLSLGISTPRVEHADERNGLLVIEDFGDDTYTRLIGRGADEEPLYALAIDLLLHLHHEPRAAAIDLPRYDEQRLVDEALLLTDWYLPALHGDSIPQTQRAGYIEAWRAVLPMACQVPETFVLRDYHVDNLMLLPGREGIASCGVLDFQDALIGPASYDVVSLLEDARRDVDPGLAARMVERFRRGMPQVAADAFDRSCAIIAAQRHAKVIGIFTRLFVRDGKPVYLKHIPRVWRLLERRLADPALAPVRHWLDRYVPPDDRRVPASA